MLCNELGENGKTTGVLSNYFLNGITKSAKIMMSDIDWLSPA